LNNNNKIEKQNKKDFFDLVLYNALNKMKIIFDRIKNKITKEKILELQQLMDDTKKVHVSNEDVKKAYTTQINQISYNNKDLVQNTWKSKNNNMTTNNIINNITNNTNNITNNTFNNILNISINPSGNENLNCLTYEDIKYIFKAEKNCLLKLTETLNFNEKYPENHNFCNTSLEGKYINVLNINNKIEKQNKKDFFDLVLYNALNKMKVIFDRIKNKITKEKVLELQILMDDVKKVHISNENVKKAYTTQINQISYNNKDLVQNTWKNKSNNILALEEESNETNSDTSDSDSSEDSFYMNKI
jgi:hypothetical protein